MHEVSVSWGAITSQVTIALDMLEDVSEIHSSIFTYCEAEYELSEFLLKREQLFEIVFCRDH